mmetsp:Transcript_50833/g.164415  ORF Transcript_50833/g.164415 Transcript_50833/m.164415 type:complete len:210 (-) Transcript_50833:1028-1657(-)
MVRVCDFGLHCCVAFLLVLLGLQLHVVHEGLQMLTVQVVHVVEGQGDHKRAENVCDDEEEVPEGNKVDCLKTKLPGRENNPVVGDDCDLRHQRAEGHDHGQLHCDPLIEVVHLNIVAHPEPLLQLVQLLPQMLTLQDAEAGPVAVGVEKELFAAIRTKSIVDRGQHIFVVTTGVVRRRLHLPLFQILRLAVLVTLGGAGKLALVLLLGC